MILATPPFGADATNGDTAATYSYLANSSLIEHTYFTNGSSRVMTTSRTFDQLNRLTRIWTTDAQSATVNSYAYQLGSCISLGGFKGG